MLPPIPPSWSALLKDETNQHYYRELDAFLDREVAEGHELLPPSADIFNAFLHSPLEQVKVLLLGQDPYPNPGDAHGLCFSVRPNVRPVPKSLKNIYRELHDDTGFRIPNNGCLEPWSRQGMLLLNTVLTVRAHKANFHRNHGWERFTDRVIELVNARPTRVVFVLWGESAKKKKNLIKGSHHAVVECAHPSPLSAKLFFGCRCFSRINQHLIDTGLSPIDWQIPDV